MREHGFFSPPLNGIRGEGGTKLALLTCIAKWNDRCSYMKDTIKILIIARRYTPQCVSRGRSGHLFHAAIFFFHFPRGSIGAAEYR